MVKALARAFRWRKILDTGVYATLEDRRQGDREDLRKPDPSAHPARAGARRCHSGWAAAGGTIQAGNEAITYYKDPHELAGKCDFVMANPPFNVDEVDEA